MPAARRLVAGALLIASAPIEARRPVASAAWLVGEWTEGSLPCDDGAGFRFGRDGHFADGLEVLGRWTLARHVITLEGRAGAFRFRSRYRIVRFGADMVEARLEAGASETLRLTRCWRR